MALTVVIEIKWLASSWSCPARPSWCDQPPAHQKYRANGGALGTLWTDRDVERSVSFPYPGPSLGSDDRPHAHGALRPSDGRLAAALARLEGELSMQHALEVAIERHMQPGAPFAACMAVTFRLRRKGRRGRSPKPTWRRMPAFTASCYRRSPMMVGSRRRPPTGPIDWQVTHVDHRSARWYLGVHHGSAEFVVSIGSLSTGSQCLASSTIRSRRKRLVAFRPGAWLNGVPMHVSPTRILAASTFCVSRTESGKGLLKGLREASEPLSEGLNRL